MTTLAKQIIDRVEAAGEYSAGAFNLAADLIELASHKAEGWTNRADDAIRIPGMLYDAVRVLRLKAKHARPPLGGCNPP